MRARACACKSCVVHGRTHSREMQKSCPDVVVRNNGDVINILYVSGWMCMWLCDANGGAMLCVLFANSILLEYIVVLSNVVKHVLGRVL